MSVGVGVKIGDFSDRMSGRHGDDALLHVGDDQGGDAEIANTTPHLWGTPRRGTLPQVREGDGVLSGAYALRLRGVIVNESHAIAAMIERTCDPMIVTDSKPLVRIRENGRRNRSDEGKS
jgi:hypothetical protein